VERLQSTAVPCETDWTLHDVLQVPAAFEEQQPLDLEAMHSGDEENSISREPPSVTIRQVESSDGALEGYQPYYKAQSTVFVNSLWDSSTVMERCRKQDCQAGGQQHSSRVSHRIRGQDRSPRELLA